MRRRTTRHLAVAVALLLVAGCGDDASEAEADAPASGTDLRDEGLRDRHPNGVELVVTGLEVTDGEIVVAVNAFNGFTDEVRLNNSGLQLIDDAGDSYNFVDPAQDVNFALASGEERNAEWTFLGRLPDSVESLTLMTNRSNPEDTIDTGNRSDYDTAPALLIEDIPVD